MTNPVRETTETFGRLLAAVRDLGGDLHGQGVIDLERLRLSIPARQDEAKRLVAGGLSLREAAKELGVDPATIHRDLGRTKVLQNATLPEGRNPREVLQNATPASPAARKPPLSDAEEERKQQRWAATSNLIDGILLFDRHNPGDGFAMAAAFDPEVAAMRREKITPARIREAIAFLEEVAIAMEQQNAETA